jgi:hypothetical protein
MSVGSTSQCNFCNKPAALLAKPLLPCPGCKAIWYCSSHCTQLDWKRHAKTECRAGGDRAGAAEPGSPLVSLRAAVRAVAAAQIGGSKYTVKVSLADTML